MNKDSFKAGDIVRVKDTGRFGRVAEVQDSPDKIRIEYDETWQGYFKPEELAHWYKTTKPDFQTDEYDLKEIDSLMATKRKRIIEPGDVFESFGSTYQAVHSTSDSSCYECAKCAFINAHCSLNVDIPSCKGVIFKRVDRAEIVAVDSNGKDVGRVDRFDNDKVCIHGTLGSFSLLDFIGKGYKLEVRTKLVED